MIFITLCRFYRLWYVFCRSNLNYKADCDNVFRHDCIDYNAQETIKYIYNIPINNL